MQATAQPLLVAACLCSEVARRAFGSSKSQQENMPLPELAGAIIGKTRKDASFLDTKLYALAKLARTPFFLVQLLNHFRCRPGKCGLLQ